MSFDGIFKCQLLFKTLILWTLAILEHNVLAVFILLNIIYLLRFFFSPVLKHTIVLQCAQEYKHLPESLYPHTYNPKMSLDISAVQHGRLCNNRLLSADLTTKDDEVDDIDDTFTPSLS